LPSVVLNDHMIRVSTAIALSSLALVLVLPAGSQATLTEVGVIPPTTSPETVPSCPGSPCLAVSRTTGFQVKVNTTHNPLAAPRAGTIVAWSIMLGKPNATQIKFFNANEGGPSTPDLQADRAEPARQARTLFRQDRPVPARNHRAGQKGRCDRADRALLGARAGPGLHQRDLLARQPAEKPVREHELTDHANSDRLGRAVLLPVSNRAPDLQRDAYFNSLGLRASP
jgi:hypothetical protein